MNVTADSAAELVDSLASTLEGSIEQVQTEDNLDRVTNVLEDVVGLLEEGNFTVDESVREHCVYGLVIAFSSVYTCINYTHTCNSSCPEIICIPT